jgi:hypothetical protein
MELLYRSFEEGEGRKLGIIQKRRVGERDEGAATKAETQSLRPAEAETICLFAALFVAFYILKSLQSIIANYIRKKVATETEAAEPTARDFVDVLLICFESCVVAFV